MKLKTLDQELSVCKVVSISDIDLNGKFFFVGKTDEEISLVCLTSDVPDNTTDRVDGWRTFRIEGVLDFSLIGILSEISKVLAENKVDVSGMAVDADHPTTMAVVSVDATGERDFSFYRSANADVMLCKEDISDEALKAAKIVHFGSVSLTADPSRTATLDAAARAKKLGATITYDPNYRANLWKNKEDAIAQMKAPLPLVDILKVSDEELPLLTGTTDCESGTAQLAQNGIRLIFVTLGANGVFYRFGDKTGHVAGVPCKVGDTNGAGDTFFGAALSKLCKEELDTLTVDKLEGILAFANKAASITTSRHGAIPAMPTLAEVEG